MKNALFLFALGSLLALSCPATGSGQVVAVSGQPTVRRLQLIITDNKGSKSVTDVQATDIELTEEGSIQTVDSLELIEKPTHYGLVIDVSGSLRSQFPLILDAARNLISKNTQEDQTFIIRFIDKAEMLQETTSNKVALFTAIEQLKPDRGQTALWDALYTSARELQKVRDPNRRQALVVITDGENRASRINETELFNLLRESDFKVFIIGLVEELDREGGFVRRSSHDRSVAFLERLAKETGGRLFLARKDAGSEISEQIAHDLRRQYVLQYRSSNAPATPRYKVEIKVRDGKEEKRREEIMLPA